VDCATLTGAARVALGPDLPALFSDHAEVAGALLEAGADVADPLWRLPLQKSYISWLDSPVADVNNVSTKPMAGAIVAALFLRHFIAPDTRWAHIDLYAWNDQSRPGRPEGGEIQAARAIARAAAKLLVRT
jgi:leucyl aminopeptidase